MHTFSAIELMFIHMIGLKIPSCANEMFLVLWMNLHVQNQARIPLNTLVFVKALAESIPFLPFIFDHKESPKAPPSFQNGFP